MRQAVILAGGKGTRLQERLNGLPKPLVDVDGRPLLERQLEMLAQSGFDEVVVLVSHAASHIRDFCERRVGGIRTVVVDDGEVAKGTAGALFAAWPHLRERFLVVYGDTLFDIDLDRFWRAHIEAQPDVTLFLHPNDHPHDSDLVDMDGNNRITGFHSYPRPADVYLPNLVNAALYVVEKQAISLWCSAAPPLDFAKDIFPRMVEAGRFLRGYITFEYIKDIGTPTRLDKAVSQLRAGKVARSRLAFPQKAIFLDRDGTINRLRGHIKSPESLELIEGVPEAIRRLNTAEYRVIVITNQPVIARGEASFRDVKSIHAKLETLLGHYGAYLDGIEFCPHHPDSGFAGEISELKINCNCRKPEIGLILRAQKAFNIDLSQSYFIGDTTSDMLAAQRAGISSILVQTGEAGRDEKYEATPDFVFANLFSAVDFILKRDEGAA